MADKSEALNLAVDALSRAGAIVVVSGLSMRESSSFLCFNKLLSLCNESIQAAAGNYHEGNDPNTRVSFLDRACSTLTLFSNRIHVTIALLARPL